MLWSSSPFFLWLPYILNASFSKSKFNFSEIAGLISDKIWRPLFSQCKLSAVVVVGVSRSLVRLAGWLL